MTPFWLPTKSRSFWLQERDLNGPGIQIMADRAKIMSLHRGGSVAIAEYGLRTGEPVFFCHGWPSSRTMAELTHTAAKELDLRIISPDRPGIRDSSFHPERTLFDWPPLLAE